MNDTEQKWMEVYRVSQERIAKLEKQLEKAESALRKAYDMMLHQYVMDSKHPDLRESIKAVGEVLGEELK